MQTANPSRKIICLTPVKNEAWILPSFLRNAEKWADHIIIADQNSDDGSIEIARAHPKVILIKNESTEFNEPERQKLLIDKARTLGNNNVLVTLDADEAFTDNLLASNEWSMIINSAVGTVFHFEWVNLMPDLQNCWIPNAKFPWAIVDDGSDHRGNLIHSPRIPLAKHQKNIDCTEIKVLHFQYVNWERMMSKRRWYMAWEHLNTNASSTIKLHRTYSHMFSFGKNKIRAIENGWVNSNSIETVTNGPSNNKDVAVFQWDNQVLELLDTYGVKRFAKIPIWDISWQEMAKKSAKDNPEKYADPRSKTQKFLQEWLEKTQDSNYPLTIKVIDRILRVFNN